MTISAALRSVEAGGFTLGYRVAGDGPPVVLLHGDCASSMDWQWALRDLAAGARVYALDLPGYGDSSKPPAPYSSGLFVDAVVAFLDALDIDRAVLVGHSLGGIVAARVARDRPERVAGLCLVSSGGLGRAVHPSLIVETLPVTGEAALLARSVGTGRAAHAFNRVALLFWRWWKAPSEWVCEQARLMALPGFAAANLRARRSVLDVWGQRESIVADLGVVDELALPILVIWGANDMVVPVTHAYAARDAVPRARLAVIEGCGHLPQIEARDQFVETLANFLGEHALV